MKQAEFWDSRARKYDNDIIGHDDLYTRTVDDTLPLLADSDVVLDFGCASGEIGLDIAPHVRKLHGIDVSGLMIDLAKKKVRDRGVENAEFRRADVFDRGLAAGSFSTVTAFNVLHLVEDIPAVLARLHNLLQPGGLLISLTPCLAERAWWFRSLVGLAKRLELAPAIRGLTFAEAEALVAGAGFEILDSATWDDKDAVRRVVARRPSHTDRPAAKPEAKATWTRTATRPPERPSDHAILDSEIPAVAAAGAARRCVGR